jgi:hypothetical protein
LCKCKSKIKYVYRTLCGLIKQCKCKYIFIYMILHGYADFQHSIPRFNKNFLLYGYPWITLKHDKCKCEKFGQLHLHAVYTTINT